jgi:hypothetical protein
VILWPRKAVQDFVNDSKAGQLQRGGPGAMLRGAEFVEAAAAAIAFSSCFGKEGTWPTHGTSTNPV